MCGCIIVTPFLKKRRGVPGYKIMFYMNVCFIIMLSKTKKNIERYSTTYGDDDDDEEN